MADIDENTWYRTFSFSIEAKTASDHEEFHEKAKATIHRAQLLLEEEEKRAKELNGTTGDKKNAEISDADASGMAAFTNQGTSVQNAYNSHIWPK